MFFFFKYPATWFWKTQVIITSKISDKLNLLILFWIKGGVQQTPPKMVAFFCAKNSGGILIWTEFLKNLLLNRKVLKMFLNFFLQPIFVKGSSKSCWHPNFKSSENWSSLSLLLCVLWGVLRWHFCAFES